MAVNIGPRIGIEGEKEYRKEVNNLITQAKTYSAEMRELESSFDDETSAMEKSRKKGELLSKQIEQQEKIVSELEKGLEASAEKYGENANETLKWKQQVANAKTELNKMRSELGKLPKSLKDVSKSMQTVGKKMQDVGGKMTKYVTAPITALGAASVAAFNEVDEGMDIVVKKTGATGEALKDLQDSAKNIATTIPTSFEAAGSAVGEVNTKFGLVGEDLEALSSKFIKFANLNDTDVSTAVDKTQKVMQAFGMETEDAGKLLDVLNATGQATGISIDTLASSMTKNASSLQQMGMSAYDAAQFLGQVEMSGANTETVMKGMQTALVKAAEDGKTLPQVLGEFSDLMASGATEQEKLTAAIELFGKKAGPAIYEACKSGSLDLKAFSTDVEDYLGNVETTFDNTLDAPDRMTVAMNKVKKAGAEIGETVLEAIAPLAEDVGNFAESIGNAYASMDEDQQKFVTAAVLAFGAAGPVVTAMGKTVEAAGTLVEGLGKLPGIVQNVTGVLGTLASPTGLAMLGLGALTAVMIKSRDEGIKSNEALQTMLTDTATATEELNTATESLQGTLTSASENIESINAKAATAEDLVNELYALEKQSNKTAEEQGRMSLIVNELNTMYPNLSLSIDETTGSLNKGKKEVKNYINEAKRLSLIEAYGKVSQETLEKLATASIALKKAEKAYADGQEYVTQAQKEYNEAIADAPIAMAGQNAILDEATKTWHLVDANVINAANALKLAEGNMIELGQAVTDGNEAVATAEEEYQLYKDSAEELSSAMGDTTEATEENTVATEKNTQSFADRTNELTSMTASAIKAMRDEQTEWDELKKSTEDSIKGQINLFDEWKRDSSITFESIFGNLESQKRRLNRYNKDLKILSQAAVESGDENFKAFVQYIADMGIEGADYARAMVHEMRKEGGNFNDALRMFGKDVKIEENLAGTLAFIKNDFQTGTQAGVKAFNSTIETGWSRLKKSTQETFHEVATSMFGLSDDAKTAGAQAAENLETEVNGANLEPEIKQVNVPKSVTSAATSEIEKDVKPTIKVSTISVWDALLNARTAMQNYFNSNPIIAKLKGGSVAHNANGGIIQNETLSWLAEGNQPEAVIPLSAGKRTRALDLYEQTGEILGVDSIPTKSSYISIPMTPASGANGGGGDYGIDAEKLYAAVAEGAAAGMENANVRIYWNDREAGRIMRDMGVQFA